MQTDDLKRLKTYYTDALSTYGTGDARSLHWSDADNQRLRFHILTSIAPLDGSSVLDVGSGLGDLYGFLKERNIDVGYTGVEIVPELAKAAHEKFPDAQFITSDISSLKGMWDYVLASGALSFKVENSQAFYFSMIQKMFALARKGLAFNMLNKSNHVDNDTFTTYDPSEVADFCRSFAPRVEIVTDYLPQDFTVYVFKK